MPGDAVLDHRLLNHWHVNDERYVRRGEHVAVDAADWRRSLTRVNRRKRGRPYVLPPTMLSSLRAMIVEMRLSYRAAEGHLRRMLSVLDMKAPDHTTIWKRLAAEKAMPTARTTRGTTSISSMPTASRQASSSSGAPRRGSWAARWLVRERFKSSSASASRRGPRSTRTRSAG